MFSLEISNEKMEEALKRHEESFEKELEKISSDEKELKKMVLKIKKSLLEQIRQNNSTYRYTIDAVEEVKGLKRQINNYNSQLDLLKNKLELSTDVFKKSIALIEELKKEIQEEKERRKPLFRRIMDFFKCLTK